MDFESSKETFCFKTFGKNRTDEDAQFWAHSETPNFASRSTVPPSDLQLTYFSTERGSFFFPPEENGVIINEDEWCNTIIGSPIRRGSIKRPDMATDRVSDGSPLTAGTAKTTGRFHGYGVTSGAPVPLPVGDSPSTSLASHFGLRGGPDSSATTTETLADQVSTAPLQPDSKLLHSSFSPSFDRHDCPSTNAGYTSLDNVDTPVAKEPTWLYLWDLCRCGRGTASVRAKQSRLTMWEILEHFGFLNDLLFICRVGIITQEPRFRDNPRLQRIGCISILYLTCIWLTSAIAYASRRYIVYHRITPSNSGIFWPILVFVKIRQMGDASPETLYMFERLLWTYQLIVRLFEDIPQLIVSAVFLANFGKNLYTYFMVAYSCMLMVITSIRMGVSYPLFGTLSLILSRTPPVDSPILNEAAPTTRNFALFVAANLTLWSITNGLCLCYVRGLSFIVFCSLMVSSAILAVLLAFYWLYLHMQAQEEQPDALLSLSANTAPFGVELASPLSKHPV